MFNTGIGYLGIHGMQIKEAIAPSYLLRDESLGQLRG